MTEFNKLQFGSFVESTENTLGLGKLVDVNDTYATVEYFFSPTDEEDRCETVLTSTLKSEFLFQETRVYYRPPDTEDFEVGRVLAYQPEDGVYLVRFPNSQSKMIAGTDLKVRCRRPIAEPCDMLARQINETAFWHQARFSFVKHLLDQKRVGRGLSALLSSSVEIVAHQASVVHRVLMDPFQRYLLADEVGLGKTIEAGVLIKQFVLDEPCSHETLIIVPEALLAQWRQELTERLHLGKWLGATVHVVSSKDGQSIAMRLPNSKMIVVDEAHHLCSWAWSSDPTEKAIFENVRRRALIIDCKLLLLSATPVLHNEKSFLAMLHLLDPQVYSLDGLDAFKDKIRLRQVIAERLLDVREDESNFFLGDAIEALGQALPDDNVFQSLRYEISGMIEADVDEDDPARVAIIRSIRQHVGDMWRLHRRVLRNRRTSQTAAYLPGRAKATRLAYSCGAEQGLAEAIINWRLALSSFLYSGGQKEKSIASELTRAMDEFAAAEPEFAVRFAEKRLSMPVGHAISDLPLCPGESEALKEIIRAAEDCDLSVKMNTLLNFLQNEQGNASFVVFANGRKTADRLFGFLNSMLPSERILRHSTKTSSWTQFKIEGRRSVLICDRSAEEGLNLQKRGAIAVHFDLPFSPNRVEQRMGRLDRFGLGASVESVVLVCNGSEVQSNWFSFLDDAVGVFSRSIASLQYVLEENMYACWNAYLDEGSGVFIDARERFGGDDGIIALELKHIRAQDAIDSFDANAITQELVDEIENEDRMLAQAGPSVFDSWAVQNLHFRKIGEEQRKDEVFSYEFTRRVDRDVRRPFGRDTLIAADEFSRQFTESIDDLPVSPPVQFCTVPFTFDRVFAQQRNCRLLRVGDPFVDAFEEFTRCDDRGISYAFWRVVNHQIEDDPALFFRFDYVVEPNRKPLDDLSASMPGVSINAMLRRCRAVFPPQLTSIWLDADLERILPGDGRRELLKFPYQKAPAAGFRDFNLNRDRWQDAATVYDMGLWEDRVYAARQKSEQVLRQESRLPQLAEEHVARAKQLAAEIEQQYRSRISLANGEMKTSLEEDLAFERKFLVAQVEAFRFPTLRPDSVGAIFLSNQSPFIERDESEDDD